MSAQTKPEIRDQKPEVSLLDRMAEALELQMEWIGAPPVGQYSFDSLREEAWHKSKVALAEYRAQKAQAGEAPSQDSRSISQETALELFQTLKDHKEWMESEGIRQDGVPIHDCDFIHDPESGTCAYHELYADTTSAIARAEAELYE